MEVEENIDHQAVAKAALEEVQKMKIENQKLLSERNVYKLKWEIECERYNELIEKVMDKI